MKHEALARACRHVGGQHQLARMIGLRQQHIWNWLNSENGVPANHVLRVEAAALVSRHDLRPDLYPRGPGPSTVVTICTEDGTWIARDPATNLTASAATLPEAVAELRRLLSQREAA